MRSSEEYQQLAISLTGAEFNDVGLLITAFTHRSYLNEHKKTVKEHNERLEFLGDAVLELVVTEYLFAKYDDPEGTLTNWRSALVRTESISAAAQRLEFAEYLRLSRGEKRGSDRAREQILANCFEAFIGALYIDRGYEPAKAFIHANILSTFQGILDSGTWMDPKSQLQEMAQSIHGSTPLYKVIDETGPDHDKTFKVGVYIADALVGTGEGPSKQIAQQRAAEKAFQKLKSNAPVKEKV